MRILLLGKTGQVGWELQALLGMLGEVVAPGRDTCDLCDLASLERVLEAVRPEVIVNAAAYTAVDRAETEQEKAFRVNGDAPALLARWASDAGAFLIHYSTDYVFDGEKAEPYVETDPVAPLNVYGASKLRGEQEIARCGGAYWIFRTSWVYGAHGRNFVKTMLRLAREREALRVVADQVGAPTSAGLIARTTALLLAMLREKPELGRETTGVYHLVPHGETSWHGFARAIFASAGARGLVLRCSPEAVEPIRTEEYPTPARRPRNSRLDTGKLEATFGLRLPRWEEELERVMPALLGMMDGRDP